jgi:hypothetical protein
MTTDALGTAKFFIEGEKWDEAKQVLDIVRPFCKSVGQLDALGNAYSEARDWKSSTEIATILYNTLSGPPKTNARHSLIKGLMSMNKPVEALRYIEEQEKEHGWNAEYQLDKSVALFMNNDKDMAKDVLDDMLRHNLSMEMLQRVRFNLATHTMAKGGDYWKDGLGEFLTIGRLLGVWKDSPYPATQQWFGQDLPAGSVLLILAEGGIGDEFINIRFAKRIMAKGIHVYWGTDRQDLANVFKRHGVTAGPTPALSPHHFWCYSMSLPVLLDLSPDELWDGPYIRASKSKSVPLHRPGTKLKVGFKVQGNPHYEQDLHRNLPCKELQEVMANNCDLNIFDFYNFDIDNLQKLYLAWWVCYLKRYITSWDDTLDYLDDMDVVVTSCTSIAHAASAMGKKTVVMVPIMNYYTWVNGKEYSDWYGLDTHVIRQTKPGCWKEPLDELGKYLKTCFP